MFEFPFLANMIHDLINRSLLKSYVIYNFDSGHGFFLNLSKFVEIDTTH